MKEGFIITAYCNTQEKQDTLFNLVNKIRQLSDIFLVVSSHTPIESRTQNLCDVIIYDKNNPADERKYSHGAAESTLICQALEILNLHDIKNTFKIPFDCEINDLNIFNGWRKPGYEMVTSKWGDINISTFAWYANVNFMLTTFSYFFTIEDMFRRGTVLEKIWEEDVENQKLKNSIFLFNDFRTEMFPGQKVDLYWKTYDEKKFSVPGQCYITFINKEFIDIFHGLAESLSLYSNTKIICYTLNYDEERKYDNVIFKRYDTVTNESLTYEKPGILKQAIKDGAKDLVFLDADIIALPDIDDIWKIETKDKFWVNRAQWEYSLFKGELNPSDKIIELLGANRQPHFYCQTNIIKFTPTDKILEFLNEWDYYCKSNEEYAKEVRDNAFIVDETICNALLNKYPELYLTGRPITCNVFTLEDVKYFENYQASETKPVGYDKIDNAYFPGLSLVSCNSIRIPDDKSEIKAFHGMKKSEEILKTLSWLKKPVTNTFKSSLIALYSDINKNTVTNIPVQESAVKNVLYSDNDYKVSFHIGAKVEILNSGKEHDVEFWDNDRNFLVYKTKIKEGWAMPNPKYLTNWKVIVNGKEYLFDLSGKDVFVKFDSKALGDNIAWISSVRKFKEKYNCNVFVATFWNNLFEKAYPELKFVDLNYSSDSLYATYLIGCKDNDYNYNKRNWRTIPLHAIADDVLGVEDNMIRPELDFVPGERPIENKYIAINTESTMQAKFWNYEHGWQTLIDYVKSLGYDVIVTQKNKTSLNGVYDKAGGTIQEALNIIYHSEAFIGLGSGLSWASWAIGKEPIIIHGIENNWYLPSNFQVTNPKVCNGCYHDISEDYGRDWNWCPRNKKFECTATIKPKQVIETLKEYLKITKI